MRRPAELLRKPWAAPLFLIGLGLLLLGPHAPGAGLHLDDHGFHQSLAGADWPAVKERFLRYVPGRNLYILYYWGFYEALGPSVERLHWLGVGLDCLNAVLAYALLLQLGSGIGTGLLAGGLFLVFPNHAETHFWTSAIGMNLLSTTFLLSAFLAAGAGAWPESRRLAAALTLFALALFDYDQVFAMWVPLLVYAARLAPGAGLSRRGGAIFAAVCGSLNLLHLLLRRYSPVSEGGRPVIRPGFVWERFLESLNASLIPMRKLPILDSLQSWAGGPAPTVALVLVLSGAWIVWVARAWKGEPPARAARWAAFGALWFLAAYTPTYFWFISPRHNYLPSFGLVLALAAGAHAARKAGPALAAAAFLGFGLSGAATLAEGYGWKRSAQLQERFTQEAVRLLGPGADNIYLLGAPRTLRRAPAFYQTGEHLSHYGYATGRFPPEGDTSLSPGRTGAFYANRPELSGENSFRRRPYAGMNVLVHEAGGGFSCASELSLTPAGLPPFRAKPGGGPSCNAVPEIEVPVWLVSSKIERAPGRRVGAPTERPILHSAWAEAGDGWLEVDLEWAVGRSESDFASMLRIYDGEGRLVFEPLYGTKTGKERPIRALWPAFNELDPPSGWKSGTLVRERHRLRVPAPLPPGRWELRAELFAPNGDGVWKPVAEQRGLLKVRP